MNNRVVSKSLAGASELCMRMPIKKGFADGLLTRSYESRLRSFTKLFSDLRTITRESRLVRPYSDIVDRIKTIHGVTISIDEGYALLVVHFDRPWEPYIKIIWRDLGRVFDAILCNCEGYTEHHRTELGYEAFAGWIRKYQINTNTYYLNTGHTVSDVIYLDQLEKDVRNNNGSGMHSLEVKNPEDITRDIRKKLDAAGYIEYIKLGVQIVSAFHSLSYLYAKGSADHKYILLAVKDALIDEYTKTCEWNAGLIKLLDNPSQEEIKKAVTPLEILKKVFKVELDWFENFKLPKLSAPAIASIPASIINTENVQTGITQRYQADLGYLALVQIVDANKALAFLKNMQNKVSFGNNAGEISINLSFTVEGLQHLGMPANELQKFPAAFLDGMAARAGLIGDLRHNHPDHWQLPQRNWPLNNLPADSSANQPVNLKSVDLVIQLRSQSVVGADPENPDYATLVAQLVKLEQLANGNNTAAQSEDAILILSVQEMYSLKRLSDAAASQEAVEHFGFRDGLSNPNITGAGSDDVAVGELYLGYPRGNGDVGPDAYNEPLFKDGSFLVVRKLQQDVQALNNVLPPEKKDILEKLMGRTQAGDPLVSPPPLKKTPNTFDFSADPNGVSCPHFSHIRRSNPRDHTANKADPIPRILRRGMSYGPRYVANSSTANNDRGIIFQAYNADISQQFEQIQRWITGGNRTTRYSQHNDPFLGVCQSGEPRVYRFDDGSAVDLGDQPFVTLNWGLYLFVPSKIGLENISNIKPTGARDFVAEGEQIINALERTASLLAAQLKAIIPNNGVVVALAAVSKVGAAQFTLTHLNALNLEKEEFLELDQVKLQELKNIASNYTDLINSWKRLLEEKESRDAQNHRAVWAAIRKRHGGVLHTPFGVLVGEKELINEVLCDREIYSASAYKQRLEKGLGDNYLGLDACAHDQAADGPNAIFYRYTEEEGFAETFKKSCGLLGLLGNVGGEVTIPLTKYIDLALAEVAKTFFGIPDADTFLEEISRSSPIPSTTNTDPAFVAGGEPISSTSTIPSQNTNTTQNTVHCPYHFISTSRSVFQPMPTQFVEAAAAKEGKQLQSASLKLASNFAGNFASNPDVYQQRQKELFDLGNDEFASVLSGALLGYMPTVQGNFLDTCRQWLRNGEFWYIQNNYLAQRKNGLTALAAAKDAIEPALIKTMAQRPVPSLIHRTAKHQTTLSGKNIAAGESVVLGLVSATAEEQFGNVDMVFGGVYGNGPNYPVHACPGRKLGMGTLLGLISALFEIDGTLRGTVSSTALQFTAE